jgi:peptidyl-prolyl cis-trans isomerase A (cyclophilin A)
MRLNTRRLSCLTTAVVGFGLCGVLGGVAGCAKEKALTAPSVNTNEAASAAAMPSPHAATPPSPGSLSDDPNALIDEAALDEPLMRPPRKDTPRVLLQPATLHKRAPARFRVKFDTAQGSFVVEVTRAWAPRGADRFYNLVTSNFYRGVRVHRVVPGSLVQFGLHGDPAVNRAWFEATIRDDRPRRPNQRGFVALVASGQDARRTELAINLQRNRGFDQAGVAPIGRVVAGLKNVERLPAPNKLGTPSPAKRYVLTIGEPYLASHYPRAARINKTSLLR